MTNSVSLGQEVFVLSLGGDVVRTMVSEIMSCRYGFLDGSDCGRPHWFSYDEAASAALIGFEARKDVLREELRLLATRGRALTTQGYRDGVDNAPYRMVAPRDVEEIATCGRFHPKMRQHVAVPETHLLIGQVVYAIITPLTPPHGDGWAVYRPYPHFVLETVVHSIHLSTNGEALYTFTTPFRPEEYFFTRKEAMNKLSSYSEPGTLEPVPFISCAKEKKELEKLRDDEDIPF